MQTIEKIIEIWISASIPVISLQSISNKLDKYIMIISKLKKSEHKLYFSKSVNEHIKHEHIKKYKILFEICTCKCKHDCLCSRERQVPQCERNFLIDQRNNRQMFINIFFIFFNIQYYIW